jgi:hypothetical protein
MGGAMPISSLDFMENIIYTLIIKVLWLKKKSHKSATSS